MSVALMPAASARRVFATISSRRRTPVVPVLLYLLFALADLLCSEVAFAYGIAEGNPFMNYLLKVGLFVPGKIALSLLVALVMAVAYRASRRARIAAWGGVAVTGAVVAYHLWALPQVILLASTSVRMS